MENVENHRAVPHSYHRVLDQTGLVPVDRETRKDEGRTEHFRDDDVDDDDDDDALLKMEMSSSRRRRRYEWSSKLVAWNLKTARATSAFSAVPARAAPVGVQCLVGWVGYSVLILRFIER